MDKRQETEMQKLVKKEQDERTASEQRVILAKAAETITCNGRRKGKKKKKQLRRLAKPTCMTQKAPTRPSGCKKGESRQSTAMPVLHP